MIVIFFIVISVVGTFGLILYHAIRAYDPRYKLQELERQIEEVYGKVIGQIERDIREPYMKRYNEYYLHTIQEKEKQFIALKEKNKDKLPEEQLSMYYDWLNYLRSICRPEYHQPSECYNDYLSRSQGFHGKH